MGLPNNIFGLASLLGFAAPAAVFLYHGFVKGIPKRWMKVRLWMDIHTEVFFSIISRF